MSKITSYKDLTVWQQAMTLAERCYQVTSEFPAAERFGLTAQIRRAAVSVVSNIAEGHSRPRPAYLNHLGIASGSLAELETQLALAVRLEFLDKEQSAPVTNLASAVGRLLHGIIHALRRTPSP